MATDTSGTAGDDNNVLIPSNRPAGLAIDDETIAYGVDRLEQPDEQIPFGKSVGAIAPTSAEISRQKRQLFASTEIGPISEKLEIVGAADDSDK